MFSVLRRFRVHYIGHFEYFSFHVLIRPVQINFCPNSTQKPINYISYNDMDLHAKLKILHLNKTHLKPTSLFSFLHFLLELSLLSPFSSFTNSYSILKLKLARGIPTTWEHLHHHLLLLQEILFQILPYLLLLVSIFLHFTPLVLNRRLRGKWSTCMLISFHLFLSPL